MKQIKINGKNHPVKPCPFCGRAEQFIILNDDDNYAVRCEWCGALGESCSTKEYALGCWNVRVEGCKQSQWSKDMLLIDDKFKQALMYSCDTCHTSWDYDNDEYCPKCGSSRVKEDGKIVDTNQRR